MSNINIKKELAPKGLDFKPSEFVISDKWCTILTVVSFPKWITPGFLSGLSNDSGVKIVIKGVKIFINKCDVESGGNKKVCHGENA